VAQIVFYATTSNRLFSRVIRLAGLGTHYSHVGCRYGDGLISAHLGDGFQVRTIESELPSLSWTWATLQVSDSQAVRHRNWLTSQIGKKYDWAAILGMAENAFAEWNRAAGWPNAWYCSAVMLQSLVEIGMGAPIKPDPLRTITPDTFMWVLWALGAKLAPVAEPSARTIK